MKLSRPMRQDLNKLYRDEVERDYFLHHEVDEDRVQDNVHCLLWPEGDEPDDYAYIGEAIDEISRAKFLGSDYKRQTQKMEVEVEVHGETGDSSVDAILKEDGSQRWIMRITRNGDKPQSVLTDRATPKQHRRYGTQQLQRSRELARKGNWHYGVAIISDMSGGDPDTPATEQGVLEVKSIEAE